MVPKAPPLPGDDGSRLNDHEWLSPPGPDPCEPGPEEAIGGLESRPFHRSLADGQLVTKGEDFELQGGAGAKAGTEEREEGGED